MATTTIRIRARRAFYALGRVFPAGAVHSFDLATAADILASGRGECIDAADVAQVRAFVETEARRVASAVARSAPHPSGRAGYF